MTGELAGRVAVVTGAGRGIGRAIARALADTGAAVVAAARSREQVDETVALIRGGGNRAIGVTADVTNLHAVDRMVAQAAEQLGPVDILVNCAGSHETIGPVWETDPEQWWRDVETNLRGTFLCARSVLPGMVARRRGWIFNVASNSAIEPGPYVSSYAAGKAAVLRFTDSVAAETGRFGIRVFAIGPGQVHTAMTDYILNSPAGQKWLPEVRDYPASLWVSPERAGQLVIFLATEEGDALSGRYIHVSDDVAELARSSERIRRDDLYVLRLRK